MNAVFKTNSNPAINEPLLRVEKITLQSHVSLLPGALFIFAAAFLAAFLIHARVTSSWPFN